MKKSSKASPIILAVLCAVGVHTVLFTDAGHRMQGAITESSLGVEVSDTSLILNGDTVSLVVQKDIAQAKKVAASIMYNNESLTLAPPESTFGTISKQNAEYSEDITIAFPKPQDITKGSILATWKITNKLPEIHTINLSDVQVESTEGTISLSTRGTGEF